MRPEAARQCSSFSRRGSTPARPRLQGPIAVLQGRVRATAYVTRVDVEGAGTSFPAFPVRLGGSRDPAPIGRASRRLSLGSRPTPRPRPSRAAELQLPVSRAAVAPASAARPALTRCQRPPLPARRPLQPPAAVSAQRSPPGHCRPRSPGARGGRAGRGAAAASGNKAAAPLLLAGREGQRALSCSAPPSPLLPPSARHRHRHALTFTCVGPRGRRFGAHCSPHLKAGAGPGPGPPRDVGAAGDGDSWAAQKSQVSSGTGKRRRQAGF